MNNQNTIEKMRQMRLSGMAEMHYTNIKNNINLEYTIDQYVSMLVDQEWENRQNRKIKNLYYNTSRLMDNLKLSRLEGNYTKSILSIEKAELLILDDFGLVAFDNQGRGALMDIVESKYDRTSIIISTQVPVSGWHELIGEGTVADAILDRIVYS